MLPKDFKLKKSDEIKLTLKQGQRSRGRYLSVFFQSQPEATFRAAVVMSKKVAGTAVKRNRTRRIIFARLADAELNLGAKAVGAIVVLVSALPEDESALITELNKCLAELSLA